MRSKAKEFKTRIIGGKYRGRKIKIPAANTTRSSKNILKEALFNTLQNDTYGVIFVELFAGSGSVGFEALSRGASRLIAFEQDRNAFEVLKKNAALFDEDIELVFGDSFANFASIAQRLAQQKQSATIYYFDPPFEIRDGMSDIYEKTKMLISKIVPNSSDIVIIEHMSTAKLSQTIGAFELFKRKKYGKSSLSYYGAI